MTTPVLICDDSSTARKQMARSLPEGWDIELSFAEHGIDALDKIRHGKGDILFLDLNMPVMDGYQTLQAILNEDLPTMVIVVSGDIQPEAYQRVKALGALEFIKKPVSSEQVEQILLNYGISLDAVVEPLATTRSADQEIDFYDSYQELANVAMGRAANLLAQLLNTFVIMPVPKVKMLQISELEMAISNVRNDASISAVCQGFIGSGVAGEALLIFNEASFKDIAELMKYEKEINEAAQLELLMDISSVLCNACLNGIADQLDINFSFGHPKIIGRHVHYDEVLKNASSQWQEILTIEMGYKIENRNINCDLLLLITEDSIASLNDRVSYLLD